MAMPLRVVQRYMVVDGEKVWTTYTLEVLGEWGWETVPVVEQEEKATQEPVRRNTELEAEIAHRRAIGQKLWEERS